MQTSFQVAVLLASFLVPNASAQPNDFQGASVAIGGAFVSGKTELSGGSPNLAQQEYSLGDYSMIDIVDVSYSQVIMNKWLMGIGATYDLRKTEIGRSHALIGNCDFCADIGISHHYSIYLKPEYAVADNVAIYAKLGYHWAKNSIKDPNGQLFNWSVDNEVDIAGLGYGFGAIFLLCKHAFVSGEFQIVNYGTITHYDIGGGPIAVKNTTATGILSLGLKY